MPSDDVARAPQPIVGIVGLGRMGAPMAGRIGQAGFELRVYDVDANSLHSAAARVNGTAAASLRNLADSSDVVVLMLPTSQIVRDVCLGDQYTPGDGLAAWLKPGSLVIDMSSSDPRATIELGALLKRKNIGLVDAPVSGGVRKAIEGSLAIMLGGEDDFCSIAEPVLGAMGNVFRTGGLGSGHALKAINNYVSAAGLAAACEALIIGRAFGLDSTVLTDIINASTGRNNSTEHKIKPFILSGQFKAAAFAMSLMAKDVNTTADLSRHLGLRLPGVEEGRRLWNEATASLSRDADHTEIFVHLNRIACRDR